MIRSSSIVMTLPNGLGVVSVMAALLSLTWLRLATSSSAKFEGRQPYLFVRKIPYVIGAEKPPERVVGTLNREHIGARYSGHEHSHPHISPMLWEKPLEPFGGFPPMKNA